MWSKIWCAIVGHKKYSPDALKGNEFIELKDQLGHSLVKVNICERCGSIYTNLIRL